MSLVKYFDLIGWLGAGLILFGYYRTSIGKWTGKSLWYEIDNLLGSSLLFAYAIYKNSPVTIILNAVWALAAIRGLSSIAERRHSRIKKTQKRKKLRS